MAGQLFPPQVSTGQKWSARRRGRFVDETGDFIAWHEGYPFYTIGQRAWLGIHLNRAVFVKDICPEKNESSTCPSTIFGENRNVP